MIYEEPTNDLRQVKHEVWKPYLSPNGLPDHGRDHHKAYVCSTVQRKWYVYEGDEYVGPFNTFEREDAQFIMFDTDRTKAIWRPRRVEWRELPMIDAKDAK